MRREREMGKVRDRVLTCVCERDTKNMHAKERKRESGM